MQRELILSLKLALIVGSNPPALPLLQRCRSRAIYKDDADFFPTPGAVAP